MEKPEVQVVRFDSSVDASINSCETLCTYQCGSHNPGCDGVCVGETCPGED